MSTEKDLKNLTIAKKNLKERTTVRIWARDKGFEYQTVIKFLNGFTGVRKIGVCGDIYNALVADGFIPNDQDAA